MEDTQRLLQKMEQGTLEEKNNLKNTAESFRQLTDAGSPQAIPGEMQLT